MNEASAANAANATERDPDLCVITCALTGVLANRKQCPNLPYTPAEIGEEAKRAYDAGAAVVHIHARNDDGSPDLQPADVRAHQGRGAQALPDPPQLLDGHHPRGRDRAVHLRPREPPGDRRPQHGHDELLEVLREARRSSSSTWSSRTPTGRSSSSLAAMNEAGVKPELECFDIGHTHGRLAAPRHGRAESRRSSSRSSSTCSAAFRRPSRACSSRRRSPSTRAGQRVGGHRHQPLPVAHARDGARARRQRARRARGQPVLAERRDGEVERRARRGRRAHGARRGAQAGDGRAGARDPRARGPSA